MNLPVIFDSMNDVLKEIQINELLKFNDFSIQYGLILTEKDAMEIMEQRTYALQSYGRIDLSIETLKELINSFCTSDFINQQNYTSTLIDLQEIFYYLKNETEDSIGDEELIERLMDYFNNSCKGSIELLQGREIEIFARNIRTKNQLNDFLLGKDDNNGI